MCVQDFLGQQVRGVEFIDHWQGDQLDEMPSAAGCIAFRFDDGVVAITSRARYRLNEVTPDEYALKLSGYDWDTWALWRAKLLSVSHQQGAPYRVKHIKVLRGKLLDANVCIRGSWASLMWSVVGMPESFVVGRSWDCAVLVGQDASCLPSAFALSEEGNYHWLHPAARLPVRSDNAELRSAAPKDWPLPIWRSLAKAGCSLRLSDVAANSALWPQQWESTLRQLLMRRGAQHLWMAGRKVDVPPRILVRDCMSAIALDAQLGAFA